MNNDKHTNYRMNLMGAEALDTMRVEIKRTVGMLISALPATHQSHVRDMFNLVIEDEDAKWELKARDVPELTVELWLHIDGGQLRLCTLKFIGDEVRSHHYELPAFRLVEVDRAMPTLLRGMEERYATVAAAVELNLAAASHFLKTRS